MFKVTQTSFINWSNIYHALVAVNIQLIVYFITGSWWVGAALGSGFYWGREHTQAATKLFKYKGWKSHIEAFEKTRGLDFFMVYRWAYWGLDAFMDLALPIIATSGLALFMNIVI